MLADRPLVDVGEDRLDFKVYAQALAELIDHPGTNTPLTIALSAPWGAGKTSLARLVDQRLSQWRREWGQPPHVVCWFNAWAHDDANHLGAAFAADVARTVGRERPWLARLRSPLPAAMLTPRDRWRRRLTIALVALGGAVAISFVPGVRDLFDGSGFAPDLDAALGARLGSVALVVLAVYVIWRNVLATAERAAKFIDDPGSEAARGSMKEVSDELGRLIRQATGERRKVVVFVDDLERCRPPRALQVCETASNLLAHPDVVTVLIADMRVIASSAALRYAALESPDGEPQRTRSEYGRLYLQKIVQIQFDLPPATEDRVRKILVDEAESDPALEGAKWTFQPLERNRFRETLDYAVLVLAVVGMIGTAAYFAVRPPESADDRATAAFTGFVLAGLVIALFGALVKNLVRLAEFVIASWRSWRTRKRLAAIDESITKQVTSASAKPVDVASTVKLAHGIEEGSPEEKLVNDRVARYFTHESPLKKEAEAQIVEFLPLIPRSAKRMMNHLRLRLYVAIRRGLLPSELDPQHLGKWVVLEERWPELTRGVIEHPEKLGELEKATDLEELEAALADLELETEASPALVDFVQTDPKLGPLAKQLISLEPPSAQA